MSDLTIPDILRSQYHRRVELNPRYSMRAFARDLDVSPGQMSLLLAGKKGISLERAKTMAERLELKSAEKDYFLNQAVLMFARSDAAKKIAKNTLQHLNLQQDAIRLSKEVFIAVSDWHHFGILFAMRLKNYADGCAEFGEAEFLSKTLKVPPVDVESALARLVKLGAIEKQGSIHRALQDYVLTGNGVPSAAIRKFHRQVIQKALVAMESQAIDERYLNTMMMTIDSGDYPKMIEEIKTFYASMMKRYGKDKTQKGDQVYALALQFFRASHPVK